MSSWEAVKPSTKPSRRISGSEKEQRNERLMECYYIIKKLLAGEEVSFDGHVHVKQARLYTLPKKQPLLLCAAILNVLQLGQADWADGLLTTAGDIDDVRRKIAVFRDGGGQTSPFISNLLFPTPEKRRCVRRRYDQWRSNIMPIDELSDFSRVEQFDEAAKATTREDVAKSLPIYTNMGGLKEKVDLFL